MKEKVHDLAWRVHDLSFMTGHELRGAVTLEYIIMAGVMLVAVLAAANTFGGAVVAAFTRLTADVATIAP